MKTTTDTIPDSELIVRYLLGDSLSGIEQAEIERRLFRDDEFLEDIQAIDLHLTTRYLRNDLSLRERELFESHFLLSQERRNALEFVRGLSIALDAREHEALSEQTPETSFAIALTTPSPRVRPSHSLPKLNRSHYFPWIAKLPRFAARRMRVAAGIAAVLVVGAVLWSFNSERRIIAKTERAVFDAVPLDFAGVWKNVDDGTHGITKLNIKVEGTVLSVEAWGACHPHDCYWGSTTAIAYNRNVSSEVAIAAIAAPFTTTFAESLVIIRPTGPGVLEVQDLRRFTDNSGRSNYASTYTFRHEPPATR